MRTRSRWNVLAGLALAVSLALTGCAGSPDTDGTTGTAPSGNTNTNGGGTNVADSPFTPVIQEYLDMATTDFEREALTRALETGKVSEADYKEAVNLFLQCMNGKGIKTEAVPDPNTGVVSYHTEGDVDDATYQPAFEECSMGTIFLVGSLYDQMATNPDNADPIDLIVQCLIRKGVYPEGFTKEEFLNISKNAGNLPTDDPFFSADSMACQSNPEGQ